VAGLRPNPLGELIALPRPPSWIQRGGRDGRKGQVGREEEGWGEEGRDGKGMKGRVEMGKGGIGPPTFWLLPPPMDGRAGDRMRSQEHRSGKCTSGKRAVADCSRYIHCEAE